MAFDTRTCAPQSSSMQAAEKCVVRARARPNEMGFMNYSHGVFRPAIIYEECVVALKPALAVYAPQS